MMPFVAEDERGMRTDEGHEVGCSDEDMREGIETSIRLSDCGGRKACRLLSSIKSQGGQISRLRNSYLPYGKPDRPLSSIFYISQSAYECGLEDFIQVRLL